MNKKRSKNQMEINLSELFSEIWANKIIILALAFIAMVFMFVKVYFFTDYTYTASGLLYVNNQAKSSQAQSGGVALADILASEVMNQTYVETLTTKSFLMDVSRELEQKYTWDQIANILTISTVNETELLSVTVESASSEVSYLVAKAVMDKAPERFKSIFPNGDIKVVDNIMYPKLPNSKGTILKTIISGFIGAVIGLFVIFIKKLLNNKIQNSKDIEKRYKLTILGEL